MSDWVNINDDDTCFPKLINIGEQRLIIRRKLDANRARAVYFQNSSKFIEIEIIKENNSWAFRYPSPDGMYTNPTGNEKDLLTNSVRWYEELKREKEIWNK